MKTDLDAERIRRLDRLAATTHRSRAGLLRCAVDALLASAPVPESGPADG